MDDTDPFEGLIDPLLLSQSGEIEGSSEGQEDEKPAQTPTNRTSSKSDQKHCFAQRCNFIPANIANARRNHAHNLRHDPDHLAEHFYCWAPFIDTDGTRSVCTYNRRDRPDELRRHMEKTVGHQGTVSETDVEGFYFVLRYMYVKARETENRTTKGLKGLALPEGFQPSQEIASLLFWAEDMRNRQFPGTWVPGVPAMPVPAALPGPSAVPSAPVFAPFGTGFPGPSVPTFRSHLAPPGAPVDGGQLQPMAPMAGMGDGSHLPANQGNPQDEDEDESYNKDSPAWQRQKHLYKPRHGPLPDDEA